MAISFNEIPAGILTPGVHVEFDNSQANQGLPVQPHKILVLAQKLAAGTAAANVPVLVTSAAQALALGGQGSMAHQMFERLKAADNLTESWLLPMDDAVAGAAAAGDITFTGPATAAGTINLYIGGRRVRAAVASADTATVIAAAVQAAIAADADLPVTAIVNGVDDAQVDLTARHKGENGNDIDLRFNYFQGEALPAGVGTTVVAMSGGTGNPDVNSAITAIGDEQYNSIVMPWTDAANLTALETELTDRFGPMTQNEGHAYAAASGTVGALGTLGDSRNSLNLTIMGTGSSPTPPHEWAASVASIAAKHGNIDPARPFQTLALPGMLPPAETARFTRSERNQLLVDGISTFTVDAGGVCQVERLITTRNLDALGIPDLSYLDVNTVLTLYRLRFQVRARISQKFPRHKLADDGNLIGPGNAVVTPKVIRAELIALAQDWIEVGLVEGIEQFKADLIVERDVSDPNRVNALLPPDLVNQLRFFAAMIQFRL